MMGKEYWDFRTLEHHLNMDLIDCILHQKLYTLLAWLYVFYLPLFYFSLTLGLFFQQLHVYFIGNWLVVTCIVCTLLLISVLLAWCNCFSDGQCHFSVSLFLYCILKYTWFMITWTRSLSPNLFGAAETFGILP